MEEPESIWAEQEEETIAEPAPEQLPEPEQGPEPEQTAPETPRDSAIDTEKLKKQLEIKNQEIQELRNKQIMEQLQASLPDPNTHPQEYLIATQQLEAIIAKEQLAEYQEREKSRLIVDGLKKQGEEFTKEQPDYEQALKSLYEMRVKQYKIQAAVDPRFKDKAYIDSVIERELLSLAQAAADTGQNAAKLLYDLALANGYSTAPTNNSALKIEAISASRSLASSSGSQAGELTEEYIANLTEEELAKLYQKSPQKIQKLLYQ